jgi:hypothetical protein
VKRRWASPAYRSAVPTVKSPLTKGGDAKRLGVVIQVFGVITTTPGRLCLLSPFTKGDFKELGFHDSTE